jgi:N-carbamoyl-L-amino-acid hydrolase
MEGLDPRRAIADLRELHRRTGGPDGARRVCWTHEWAAAREFLRERLAELPVEVSVDAAGNLWAELAGESDQVVVVGSHLDSVPAGGWLDGALGVMAGLEVLRAAHAAGEPPRTLALVDWADEEGARFGRSLLGSSAFAGTLDPDTVRGLKDSDGVGLPAAIAEHGVDIDAMAGAGAGRRERLHAYVELHIEQGPVLAAGGISCAPVAGCAGIERRRLTFTGRTSHAGSTPMKQRADAAVAAARTVVAVQEIARDHDGVGTVGRIDCEPGIVTAIAGRAELLVDQRHLDPEELAAMASDLRAAAHTAAAREDCESSSHEIWSIAPVPFDAGLVAKAAEACAVAGGSTEVLPSGALHDAAELARVVPAAMVFVPSLGGVSHSSAEDTPDADIEAGITAVALLAERIVAES